MEVAKMSNIDPMGKFLDTWDRYLNREISYDEVSKISLKKERDMRRDTAELSFPYDLDKVWRFFRQNISELSKERQIIVLGEELVRVDVSENYVTFRNPFGDVVEYDRFGFHMEIQKHLDERHRWVLDLIPDWTEFFDFDHYFSAIEKFVTAAILAKESSK